MRFTKMEGAGNDYIYFNCFETPLELSAQQIRAISDRHFGVGGDGVIYIRPSAKADAQMVMHNADGSYSEMCGNGVRCVGKFIYDHGIARKETVTIETGAGVLTLQLYPRNGKVEKARVDMGAPILEAAKIPTALSGNPVVDRTVRALDREFKATCVSMGNPHCVIFLDEDVKTFPLETYGPAIENNRALFPNRVNVEFINVISKTEFIQRTWERGTGETLACGTGASAVCVAGVLAGRGGRNILNHLTGGDLELEWNERDNHVYKTGPAVEVFTGEWNG